MVQVLKDYFGCYVVMWGDAEGLVHTRHFYCRTDAKQYARKLECRLEMDFILDEVARFTPTGVAGVVTLH